MSNKSGFLDAKNRFTLFLADRTARERDRLLARYCGLCLSVCLFVTMCIVALRVGVGC